MNNTSILVQDIPVRSKRRSTRFDIDLSSSTLCQVLESYELHRRKVNKRFSTNPIREYLHELEGEEPFWPEDVGFEFFVDFELFMLTKDVCKATIHLYAETIVSALNWAVLYRCPVSPDYRQYRIDKSTPKTTALSPDEVSHLAHFDVNTLPYRPQLRRTLEIVRDAFIIQVCLFQRYSDICRICKDNFDGHIFTCTQKKTGARARVDIDKYSVVPKYCITLLEKYNYEFPYKGTLGNFNRHLHQLVSMLGGSFDDTLTFEDKINGEIVKTCVKKHELVTSHCARRTAITNAIRFSKTESEVRRCSGHAGQHHDSFQRYIVYND